MTAVAIQNRDLIIKRVQDGVMLKAIAAELSVTPGALSQHLANDPEYRAAREIGAEIRLEEQSVAIQEATSKIKLARAREGFRAAAWFAEREFPHRWGQQKTVLNVTLDLGDKLQAAKARIAQNTVAQTPITVQGERIIEQTTVRLPSADV